MLHAKPESSSSDRLLKDIDTLKKTLLGDAYSGAGLIDKLSELERRLGRLEQWLDRSRYTLIGLLLFACSGVYENVKKLFHALDL